MKFNQNKKVGICLLVVLALGLGWYFLLSTRKQTPLGESAKSTPSHKNTEPSGSSPSKAGSNEVVPAAPIDSASGEKDSAQQSLGEKASVSKAEPLAQGCYSINFTHKKLSSHADGEACLRHNNVISLESATQYGLSGKINPSSICILVNGSAVKFSKFSKGKKDLKASKSLKDENGNSFLFGPVAGPRAVVTARFCFGQTQCSEKCVIPRDEFMSALGADDGDETSGNGSTVGWDGSKEVTKEEAELEAETSSLKKEKEEAESGNKNFFDWIPNGYSAACGEKSVNRVPKGDGL